jgi:hypothetical protein
MINFEKMSMLASIFSQIQYYQTVGFFCFSFEISAELVQISRSFGAANIIADSFRRAR